MASTLPHEPDDSENTACTTTPISLEGQYVKDTMDDMRAIASSTSNKSCQLNGFTTKGDGAGGFYYWDASASDADDGFSIIRPDDFSSSGLWKKLI